MCCKLKVIRPPERTTGAVACRYLALAFKSSVWFELLFRRLARRMKMLMIKTQAGKMKIIHIEKLMLTSNSSANA